MTQVNHVPIRVVDNSRLDRFREIIFPELSRLGPHPDKPLNVRRASELAKVSENTAGKYVDLLESYGELRINHENPPAKFLYLPTYSGKRKGSSGNDGEGVT